jgi:hypothetical protein
MTRFCPSCHTEVEARDGHCLLGHPLRLEAPVSSISELRAEVDKAFEDARAEIAAVLVTEVPGHAVLTGVAPGSMPPPPPPPASRFESVWRELEAAEPERPSDPITAFAPPPRMDWGPRKSDSRLRMPFTRTRATKLA